MNPSAAAALVEPLRAIGIVPVTYGKDQVLGFVPSPPRVNAFSRDPNHHVCDAGIWRPDDQISCHCASWLTDGGGRILLVVDGTRAAVELSQGAYMFNGLSLLNDSDTEYGMVDRLASADDLEWWCGFFFACVHFGLHAWTVNVDSGRVVRALDTTWMGLSHLAGDSIPSSLHEFFEYRQDDAWTNSTAVIRQRAIQAEYEGWLRGSGVAREGAKGTSRFNPE